MFHGHTSVFSRTACRHLLMCIMGILIALGIAILCQTALTEDAQADPPEEEVAFMAVDESSIETDETYIEADEMLAGTDEDIPDDVDPESVLDDEDPAEPEDPNDTGGRESTGKEEPVRAEEAIPDDNADTEHAVDAAEAIIILSEDPLDPEPQADDALEIEGGIEGIETEEDDEPDPAGDSSEIENIKLRSGGVSADPMDVLLGVVARHQRQGDNIQVISSDSMTGRVVYATD